MTRGEEYRQYADECLRVAQGTTNSADKLIMLQMAQKWRELAEKAECREQWEDSHHQRKIKAAQPWLRGLFFKVGVGVLRHRGRPCKRDQFGISRGVGREAARHDPDRATATVEASIRYRPASRSHPPRDWLSGDRRYDSDWAPFAFRSALEWIGIAERSFAPTGHTTPPRAAFGRRLRTRNENIRRTKSETPSRDNGYFFAVHFRKWHEPAVCCAAAIQRQSEDKRTCGKVPLPAGKQQPHVRDVDPSALGQNGRTKDRPKIAGLVRRCLCGSCQV